MDKTISIIIGKICKVNANIVAYLYLLFHQVIKYFIKYDYEKIIYWVINYYI